MNLDRYALADLKLLDAGSERYHCAHLFVAGREVLVEWQAAFDRRRRPVIDDLEIGGADRCVNTNEHSAVFGTGTGLVPMLSWPGSPSTAFMLFGIGNSL